MNDIKTIPFELIYQRYKHANDIQLEATLNGIKKVKERQYDDNIKRIAALAGQFNYEAGSDGLEEYARESVGDFDPSDIELPYEVIKDIKKKNLAAEHKLFCEEYLISSKLEWLPHQLLAYFGSWAPIKNVSGKYSAKETLQANAKTDWGIGISLFGLGSRSNFFNKAPRATPQYKSSINPLVPIILGGFKKYQNIPYSAWDTQGLDMIVDSDLYEAMVSIPPELTKAEILTLRNTALTDTSGPRAGRPQPPTTSAKLNHLATTSIGSLPRLAKVMVIQTWCAHPENRTSLTITNPLAWDTPSIPLIETSVIKAETNPSKWSANDTPWI